ncbi:MAG: HAD hydrolase-like protein, partial [Christensenellaceae bacterium]|nr:HAD hydrolase-like protein [Christensenellaceae bacterium]
MQKDICLFDLDGTLIDSKFGILNCLRYALLQNGIDEQDPAVLDEFVGPPLYDTFIRVYGFSHEKSLEATATYRRRFAEKGVYEHKIYEGAKDMLKALKAAGKKIMLATSKPLPFAKSILQQYELTALFDFIGGSNMDNTRSKKAEVIRYIL